jgi:hypothetical protein
LLPATRSLLDLHGGLADRSIGVPAGALTWGGYGAGSSRRPVLRRVDAVDLDEEVAGASEGGTLTEFLDHPGGEVGFVAAA